jgi:hypothetical protein
MGKKKTNNKTWDIEKAPKRELITYKIMFIILGLCFLFMGLFAVIFILPAILCFYLAHSFNKELKRRKNVVVVAETPVEPVKEPESPYIFLRFKVAGVTFKNGRKTRQAILRAFKWGDEIPETVDFELYEYEGRPAVYVKINDQIVGNIPSDTTETFLEYERQYERDNIHCDIYGGSKLDDGTRTNYGCEIIIIYLKERG